MLIKGIFATMATGVVAAGGITSSNPPHHVEISAGAIPYSAADPAYNTTMMHFDCGTTHADASQHFINTVKDLHDASLAGASSGGSGATRARLARLARRAPSILSSSQITVPLYIHVVTKQSNANTITQQMVTDQVTALNADYAPMGVSFNLQGTTFTANDDWAVGATDTSDIDMKTALRRGSYNTLNLYFQTDLVGGILGKCTLPTTVTSDASSYTGDGCNVAAGTMPGGPIYGYNEGKTAVHETGHWLGLLHTFEGYSCVGPGDYINDTAPESQSTSGCPINPWKNTCPRKVKGVVDPIHNYMDYSIDSCYTRFTPGQRQRIFTLWAQYRQAFGGGMTNSSGSSASSSDNGNSDDRKDKKKNNNNNKKKGKGSRKAGLGGLAGVGIGGN